MGKREGRSARRSSPCHGCCDSLAASVRSLLEPLVRLEPGVNTDTGRGAVPLVLDLDAVARAAKCSANGRRFSSSG
jgi:hypothetical protein